MTGLLTSLRHTLAVLLLLWLSLALVGCDERCTEGEPCSCAPGRVCDLDCEDGDCELTCGAGAVCDVSCPAGHCDLTCAPGTVCDLNCRAGGCDRIGRGD